MPFAAGPTLESNYRLGVVVLRWENDLMEFSFMPHFCEERVEIINVFLFLLIGKLNSILRLYGGAAELSLNLYGLEFYEPFLEVYTKF